MGWQELVMLLGNIVFVKQNINQVSLILFTKLVNCTFAKSFGGGDGGGRVDGLREKGGGKKMLSAPFLTPKKNKILVLLSASVERFGVSLSQFRE